MGLTFTGYEILILAAVAAAILLDLAALAGVFFGWFGPPIRAHWPTAINLLRVRGRSARQR